MIENFCAKLKSSNRPHFAPTKPNSVSVAMIYLATEGRLTMERPELGTMPNREMTLAAVRFGEISPSLAEKWVTNMGLEPFPPFPNIGAFDPMQEQEWTLPMAAA